MADEIQEYIDNKLNKILPKLINKVVKKKPKD